MEKPRISLSLPDYIWIDEILHAVRTQSDERLVQLLGDFTSPEELIIELQSKYPNLMLWQVWLAKDW